MNSRRIVRIHRRKRSTRKYFVLKAAPLLIFSLRVYFMFDFFHRQTLEQRKEKARKDEDEKKYEEKLEKKKTRNQQQSAVDRRIAVI